MWTSKTIRICWSFLHKACWRVCWPLRWVLQRQAWMTQSLGSGQGNRGEAGGSRTNTQPKTKACTHPLLAWGWKEGKHLAALGFFYLVVKHQSHSGGQEAGLWDHLSFFPLYLLLCTLLLGKFHFFKIRATFQAFLPSCTSDSNTALILVTCVKQSAASFLLMWYWQYKLNTVPFPTFVVGFIWRVQNVFPHAVIQAKSQLVKLHHLDSGWTYKENTILISGLGQTDKLSDFMHDFC